MTLFAVRALKLKSQWSDRSWHGEVPFHCCFHEDKTPSLSINFDKGLYHCFSCNRAGHISQLYREVTGSSLYKDTGQSTDEFTRFAITHTYEYQEPDYTLLPSDAPMIIEGSVIPIREAPAAIHYLRNRGIPFSQADAMQMLYMEQGTINGTQFSKRLLIPIYERGFLLAIEGRDVTGTQSRKVLYPKDSSVSTLYEWDKLQKTQPLYIVEGLIDLAILRTDPFFHNSTTIFGASLSRRQLWLLNQCSHSIIIPDNDTAGRSTLRKLKEELSQPFSVLPIPRLGNIKDVGDIPKKLHTTVQALRSRGWSRTTIPSSSLIFTT
jgi:DNA primase